MYFKQFYVCQKTFQVIFFLKLAYYCPPLWACASGWAWVAWLPRLARSTNARAVVFWDVFFGIILTSVITLVFARHAHPPNHTWHTRHTRTLAAIRRCWCCFFLWYCCWYYWWSCCWWWWWQCWHCWTVSSTTWWAWTTTFTREPGHARSHADRAAATASSTSSSATSSSTTSSATSWHCLSIIVVIIIFHSTTHASHSHWPHHSSHSHWSHHSSHSHWTHHSSHSHRSHHSRKLSLDWFSLNIFIYFQYGNILCESYSQKAQ